MEGRALRLSTTHTHPFMFSWQEDGALGTFANVVQKCKEISWCHSRELSSFTGREVRLPLCPHSASIQSQNSVREPQPLLTCWNLVVDRQGRTRSMRRKRRRAKGLASSRQVVARNPVAYMQTGTAPWGRHSPTSAANFESNLR